MQKVNYLDEPGRIRPPRVDAVSEGLNALKELSLALSKALDAVETFEVLRTTQPPDLEQSVDFYGEVRRLEITLIRHALRRAGGSQKRAALLLGIKPTTLNSKIKAYELGRKSMQAD